ncbi:hypothetical protein Poli38472_011970 [Pythium oligandrum]|uniref:Protein kinase domain-containing protein n=1 Tax=Pythium oligandrum TaxID=41045 RepID=A0A8K1FN16_PYTOL|nr:hypothetical protein Poli38472_011970 [Pythium oligandrum]|eukprot:TMW66854.1 hypothetical protein Poli38472_011970 [Pythium oligandrum]
MPVCDSPSQLKMTRRGWLLLALCLLLAVNASHGWRMAESRAGSGSVDTPPTTTPPPTPTTTPPSSGPPVSTPPTPTTVTPKPTPTPTPPEAGVPSNDGSGGGEIIETPAPTTSAPTNETKVPTPAPDSSASEDDGSGSVGEIVPTAAPQSTPGSQTIYIKGETKTDRLYGLVIGVGIAAVVIIMGVVFIMRRYRRKKEEDEDDRLDSYDDFEMQVAPASHARYYYHDDSKHSSTERGSMMRSNNSATKSSKSHSNSNSSSSHNSNHRGTLISMNDEPLSEVWKNPAVVSARIPFEKIEFGDVIGRGGFGEVLHGVYHGQHVAIKRLIPENRKKMECLEEFLHEVILLASMEHERIVAFIGVAWDSPRELCIVLEYMANGDLRTILSEWKREGRAPGFDEQKLEIALHVAEGLTYLHSMSPKIVHRDLKSRNVLLNDEWNAKLSDFGVSREESTHRTMTSNVGSSLWIAPEVMMGNDYNEKADIFSFGILLTELDSHQLPYHNVKTPDGRDVPDAAILHMVTMGKIQAEFSAMSRTDIVLLGRACLSLDPGSRPSAPEIRHRIMQIIRSL